MAEIEIKSEIAGKVWLIEAEAGTDVEEDDAVIILESMKMESRSGHRQTARSDEILIEGRGCRRKSDRGQDGGVKPPQPAEPFPG